MWSIARLIAFVSAAMVATHASAASLLTRVADYSGPALNLTAYDSNFGYTYLEFAISLPGGITLTASDRDAAIGCCFGYFLADNGVSFQTIVATNSGSNVVTFTFDSPVSAFGSGMNYTLIGGPFGNDPTISAFGINGELIAAYNLYELAPINTPNATDIYLFRGIDGEGVSIASFTLSGSGLIITGASAVQAIPEPESWTLLICGFGLIGLAARRQKKIAS